MYRQRRAVELIVTMEVMRLERRLAVERGDLAGALAPADRTRSDRNPVRRLSLRSSSG
jgi:hypothetical protein